jgi:pilus assembly protein CpaF
MKPISIRDALNSSPRESYSTSEPLSVVGVCLNEETWSVLKAFAESAPLIRLRAHIPEYRVEETDPAADWLGSPAPDICIIDFDRDRRKAAQASEMIHSAAPDTALFAVSSDAQPDLIIQAMRSGCSEYLLKPMGREQLLNAVARVGGRRKERLQPFKAQVLAFMGAKGGCGVTSLVTQLGALLAGSLGRKTLLVDLHPDFGDAALYLGLTRHRYHFFELVENNDRLDAELLQSFLARHSSGLELIPAPEGTDTPRRIVPGAVAQTFDFLRMRCECILVDMPPGLSDENLEMIRHCDQFHVVTVSEVSALRNVVRHFEYLTRKEIPRERFRVILNRHQKRSLITDGEIEKTLGQRIFWKVPNQYAHMVKAINGGDPIALLSNSEVTKSLKDLASILGAKPGQERKREGSGLFGLGTLGVATPAESKRTGLSFKEYQELKSSVHRDLISRVDLQRVANQRDEFTRGQVLAVIQDLVANLKTPLSGRERERLSLEVLDEVFGLGPLEPLLQDPTINDILVNGPKQVYIERAGVIEECNVMFKDNAHLMNIIDKIVSAVGRRVDESSPMVDARLADGSRVNVIIPPLAIDGPHLSIRRFGHIPLTEDDLLKNQTLTPPMLELLRGAVKARLNIIISGGTGAGKTTLLNVLSGYISDKERIVTIEDSAELQMKQRHCVRLETRPSNIEGRGAIMQRQLVINSLRMRPDRIVVGEVRGEEALDMLQAMNTGHDGSLTTVHANSPRDALARVETMAMMANLNLPERAVRRQISAAIQLVVQIARFYDGSRRVTHLSEITGMEEDVITMQDVFVFERQGVAADGHILGAFTATGIRPKFADRLKMSGINVSSSWFEESFPV